MKKARKKKPMMVREVAVLPEAPETDTAKLFWNGRSQAVRLPKAFRFEGNEVHIRRSGDAVILEPLHVKRGWPPGFWESLGKVSPDFADAVMKNRLTGSLRVADFDAPA